MLHVGLDGFYFLDTCCKTVIKISQKTFKIFKIPKIQPFAINKIYIYIMTNYDFYVY